MSTGTPAPSAQDSRSFEASADTNRVWQMWKTMQGTSAAADDEGQVFRVDTVARQIGQYPGDHV